MKITKKIINLILIAILIIIYIFSSKVDLGELRWNTKNVHYVKGKVLEISEENIEYRYDSLPIGNQVLKIKLLEGEKSGEEIIVENTLFSTHSILAKKGSRLIVLIDSPEGYEPFYSIYNYDRSFPLAIYLILFIILLYIIGKKDGLKSALVLFISIYLIGFYMLPSIYLGQSVILVTFITILLASIYSTIILYGYSLMGLVNLISLAFSLIISAILFYLVSATSHISGFKVTEAESLFYIAEKMGMQIEYLLFSGISISIYGASKDISVSISSSLYEIKTLNKNMTARDLFKSGMNIGKDIIGTMTDTLIFAFLGSSIATVLALMSYGVKFNQLISSDFFTIEVAFGLVSTSVIVLMVPISAYFSGLIYSLEEKSWIKKFLTE